MRKKNVECLNYRALFLSGRRFQGNFPFRSLEFNHWPARDKNTCNSYLGSRKERVINNDIQWFLSPRKLVNLIKNHTVIAFHYFMLSKIQSISSDCPIKEKSVFSFAKSLRFEKSSSVFLFLKYLSTDSLLSLNKFLAPNFVL